MFGMLYSVQVWEKPSSYCREPISSHLLLSIFNSIRLKELAEKLSSSPSTGEKSLTLRTVSGRYTVVYAVNLRIIGSARCFP